MLQILGAERGALRDFVVTDGFLGIIMDDHALAGGSRDYNRATAMQQVGVPDKCIAFFGVEYLLGKVILLNDLTYAPLIVLVGIIANAEGRAAIVKLGVEYVGQGMATQVIKQRAVFRGYVFQSNPDGNEVPKRKGSHVDGVRMGFLFASL